MMKMSEHLDFNDRVHALHEEFKDKLKPIIMDSFSSLENENAFPKVLAWWAVLIDLSLDLVLAASNDELEYDRNIMTFLKVFNEIIDNDRDQVTYMFNKLGS